MSIIHKPESRVRGQMRRDVLQLADACWCDASDMSRSEAVRGTGHHRLVVLTLR